jgi:spore coat polysaccharide biosynthesis protein SpsF
MFIKQAKLIDAKFIYHVVNISRKYGHFTKTKPLNYKAHIVWFKKKLDLNKDRIYLAYHDKKKLGYIRFDFISKGLFEISLALLPKYFGKNFGTKMLSYSVAKFKEKFKLIKIVAKVKKHNKRSQKFFIKNGFKNIRYCKKVFKKLISYNKYVFYKLNMV